METNFFHVEFKSVNFNSGKIYIEGYFTTPDVDRYNDITLPTAFIKSMPTYMQEPLVLRQHDINKIVGKTLEYRIEEKGVWVRIELFNDIDGLFTLIQNGMIKKFSFGFRAIQWEIIEKGEERIRLLKEVEIAEISVVNGEINPQAMFTLTKSITNFFDGLEQKSKLDLGVYEIKGEHFEKLEMKADEIEQIEEKKDEVEEEQPNEEITNTPADVVPQEEEKEEATIENETKSDEVEIPGETPDADITEEVKSDEMKALESEIVELKSLLITKDEEIAKLTVSETEVKAKLEAKELEIKDYLSVGLDDELEKKAKTSVKVPTFVYSEFYK